MRGWISVHMVMEEILLESSLWNFQQMEENLLLEVATIQYMSMILKLISFLFEFWLTE